MVEILVMDSAQERERLQGVERQAALDDLLSRWHWWLINQPSRQGYNGHGNVTHEYRAPPSYADPEDAGEANDRLVEIRVMGQVNYEVQRLDDPWRSAIYAIARSVCVGSAVFHSPRIPVEQRAAVTLEARKRLMVRLISAGLM